MTEEQRAEISRQNGKKNKRYNKYEIVDDIAYVKLTNTGNTMICDANVWEQWKEYGWYETCYHYVQTNIKGKKVFFHRIVLKPKDDFLIDHINRNKLDNRRENLRYATRRVNAINKNTVKTNTSGTTGVFLRETGKWQAVININKKHKSLGCYASKEDAIKARKEAEEKYYKTIIENETC